jgi:hypothetical protein
MGGSGAWAKNDVAQSLTWLLHPGRREAGHAKHGGCNTIALPSIMYGGDVQSGKTRLLIQSNSYFGKYVLIGGYFDMVEMTCILFVPAKPKSEIVRVPFCGFHHSSGNSNELHTRMKGI